MTQMSYSLDQRYSLESGLVFASGIQALVRLALEQRRLDQAAGIDSGGFISGYRGSPLGGLDQSLWAEKARFDELNVRFQPGINEELAATAVWGSQQVGLFPGARVDGVFGMWYGKAPGLDRACDALRHANQAGTSQHGGVLLVTGDDHAAKSSSLATMSELTLKDLGVPILNPSSVQDVLDFGLFGWALSRYCGTWAGLIALADTMDSGATIAVGPERHGFVLPAGSAPDGHIRLDDDPLAQERRLHEIKLPAAARFAAANGINRQFGSVDGRARLGIVTTGKAYLDLRQALAEMGHVTDADLDAAGIAVLKLGMSWPLVDAEIRDFAARTDRLLVVESKRAFVEAEIRNVLYGAGAPQVLGKRDADGAPLLPETGEVSVPEIVRVLSRFVPGAANYLGVVEASRARLATVTAIAKKDRLPLFCAGCPHNTSTRVPDGSRANAGIGCHYMAQWMDRSTQTVTQMGGEGANWIGQAPFTDETHIFANLGDGTYFHSGLLAIRQAVASGVNVTYKVLFNDAVAMTGGQPVEGELTVATVLDGVRAEGVTDIAVVSDAPDDHVRLGVPVFHRDDLDDVQRDFRARAGCSVIVYVQTCATELRRRRKCGVAAQPTSRVVINEAVCEGCGDCSVQSSCVAVEPVETDLGEKRAINQTACNVDLSCVKGFCPSFVEVEGAAMLKRSGVDMDLDVLRASVPAPAAVASADGVTRILITGVGGTGIVTVSALLGTAAHLEGKSARTLDMTGLAQKGGAVFGHVQIADDGGRLFTPRITDARTDVLLACDVVSASARDALELLDSERTTVVANAHIAPTADFVLHQHSDVQAQQRLRRLQKNSRTMRVVDSIGLTEELLGDAACANVFMLGYAFQQGGLPLSIEAIERAIELNGVAVAANLSAFHFGRLAAHDPHELPTRARQRNSRALHPKETRSLAALVDHRSAMLERYQNRALAERFEQLVTRVADAEQTVKPGSETLARSVANGYAKLLAYKDEYEVARLITDPEWRQRLAEQFEPGFRLKFWLAPPLLGTRKRRFGGWVLPLMRVLARFKWLRGSTFDPFSYLPERRQERQLIEWYERLVEDVLDRLDRQNLPTAVELASLASEIRGFGHVKAAAVERAEARETALRERLAAPASAIQIFDPSSRAA